MSRTIQSFLGLALFIGLGFVTRYDYRQWIDTTIKEAQANSKKEMAHWKSVGTNYSDLKFNQQITIPPIDLSRPAMPNRSK